MRASRLPRSKPTQFYVSPLGRDDWSGKLPELKADGSDGPFASLEAARDAIRKLRRGRGLPSGGATVWLRGGDHVRERTFELTKEDSGTQAAPIVYRACEGERPRLLGGRLVKGFRSVSDRSVLQRLDPKARKSVLEADLRAVGINDFGRLRSRGFGRAPVPAHMELFFGDTPMTLARWPNEGFVTIAAIPEAGKDNDAHGQEMGRLEAGFHYDGDRPKRWRTTENVWVHGYWTYDWANSYEEVESIETQARLIKTKPPRGNYGFRTGQRFYFLNVLEELDQPGEYYVDSRSGLLYFWPPGPIAEAEAIVSMLETPLVSMRDVSHVTFGGLTLETTRGTGIEIRNGAGNLVEDCLLRNLGSDAIVIEGGTGHAVEGCEIYGVGDGGIRISGGDRRTLTPCGHSAVSNHIHNFSRWSRCYTPAILFSGVGVRVAHNLIHDAPHTGILYLANDSVIEFNEIHHVTLETGDCGAIYTGRDFAARGNIIRHNYIHDTGGYGMGSMAVYLDDCVSGQTLYGNLFVRTTRAAFIGGGRDVLVENNVFVDCEPAVDVDGRGLDKSPVWHDMIYKTMKERLEEVNYRQPPYSERYPELLQLDRYYARDDGVPPENNVIVRNICVGGRWLDVRWHAEEKHILVRDNLVGVDPRFVDPAAGDYRLRKDSPAWSIGFKPLPLERIGLLPKEPPARPRRKARGVGPVARRAPRRKPHRRA